MKNKLLFFLLWLYFPFGLSSKEPHIGVYYENYSLYYPPTGNRPLFAIEQIPGEWITEVFIAFGSFGYLNQSINPHNYGLTGNFQLQPTESTDIKQLFPALRKLKQKFPRLKLILSLGGWNFNNPQDPVGSKTAPLFSQMISNANSRQEFIESALKYLQLHGLDGLDLDWEYPGDLERGGSGEDFANFLIFLEECQSRFKAVQPPLILCYTAPAFVPKGFPKHWQRHPEEFYQWLAKCTNFLDQLNVMCYDYHGPFDDPKITGANAPLLRDTDPASLLFIENTLKSLAQNQVPSEKIVLGLPTFGHSYAGVDFNQKFGPGLPFRQAGAPGPATKQAGLLSYYEIADLIVQKNFTLETDPLTQTAFAYQKNTKEWISFDTPQTIALKVKLAQKYSLKGVYFWSINMDEYQWPPRFPNLKSAYEVLNP